MNPIQFSIRQMQFNRCVFVSENRFFCLFFESRRRILRTQQEERENWKIIASSSLNCKAPFANHIKCRKRNRVWLWHVCHVNMNVVVNRKRDTQSDIGRKHVLFGWRPLTALCLSHSISSDFAETLWSIDKSNIERFIVSIRLYSLIDHLHL